MNKMSRFANYDKPVVAQESVTFEEYEKIKFPERKIFSLEGFEDPLDAALIMSGVDADFINPHAEVITMETQQMDEALLNKNVQSIFYFNNVKNNVFTLAEALVKDVRKPEKTIFIIKEKDIEKLNDAGDTPDTVISFLKNNAGGVFTTINEAKDHILQAINSNAEEQGVVSVSDVVNSN